MARKSSSTAVQEELYPLPGEGRESFDARFVDLEADEESPFLRAQRRVSVRRGPLPKKTVHYLLWVGLALVLGALLAVVAGTVSRYGERSWRFRIDSSDQIEIAGAEHITRGQIMEVMGGDIGRNIFFVPLAQRKAQLERIPWVQSASVMRFVPNRLRVEIHERTPVAFARIGAHVSLIDASGTLMELSPGGKHKYSFPVISGMNAGEPHSTRAARMKNYNELVRQLDSGGSHNSQALSEVDLTDTEDTKVVVSDPSGEVLVHLGSSNYLPRYQSYVANIAKWRERYQKLESVDLRYDGQIILNPDFTGTLHPSALTPVAAKAALAAGVKPSAIVNYEKYVTHPAAPAPLKPAKGTPKTVKHRVRRVHRHRARATKAPPAVAAKSVPASPASIAVAKPAKADAAPPTASHPHSASSPVAETAAPTKPSAGIPKEMPPN